MNDKTRIEDQIKYEVNERLFCNIIASSYQIFPNSMFYQRGYLCIHIGFDKTINFSVYGSL